MSSRIVLASASPRRSRLMESIITDFQTAPADVDEWIPEGTPPRIACMYNALRKAQCAAGNDTDQFVIGADTIVWDGRILGKPADDREAFHMLAELRDRVHSVFTGVCIISSAQESPRLFCEQTEVEFGSYSDEDIRSYILTGEPADKAGAYAIQGLWSVHVRCFHGDRNNVIGLPVDRLREELVRLGADWL